jgi:hypothetical protein
MIAPSIGAPLQLSDFLSVLLNPERTSCPIGSNHGTLKSSALESASSFVSWCRSSRRSFERETPARAARFKDPSGALMILMVREGRLVFTDFDINVLFQLYMRHRIIHKVRGIRMHPLRRMKSVALFPIVRGAIGYHPSRERSVHLGRFGQAHPDD